MDSLGLSILFLVMHYMVYVLCNPARTIFFLGLTGGFTDGIFDTGEPPDRVSIWINCELLVHHKSFREFEEAVNYIDNLQKDIEQWNFNAIEKSNRRWRDLSGQWLNPSRLLSFQSIRKSFYCMAN